MKPAEGISSPQTAPHQASWHVPQLGSAHCSLPTAPEANTVKRQGKEEGTIFLHASVCMGASQHLQSYIITLTVTDRETGVTVNGLSKHIFPRHVEVRAAKEMARSKSLLSMIKTL